MPTAEVPEAPKPAFDSRIEQVEAWIGPLSEGDRAIVDAVNAIPEEYPDINRTRFEEEDGTKISLSRSKDVGYGDQPINPEEDGVLKDEVDVQITSPDGAKQIVWARVDASALTRRGDGIFAGIEEPSSEGGVSVSGDTVNRGRGEPEEEDHEAAEAVKVEIARRINDARKRAYPLREVDKDLAQDMALEEEGHMRDIHERNAQTGYAHQTVANGHILGGGGRPWTSANYAANAESARLADKAAQHVLQAAGVEVKQPKH